MNDPTGSCADQGEFYDSGYVAKQAPYGNDFTEPQDVRLRNGRLIYYNSPEEKFGHTLITFEDQYRSHLSPEFDDQQYDQTYISAKMPVQQDNFTGVVPAYITNGHHYLPKLNGGPPVATGGGASNQRQSGVLPAIPTSPTGQEDGAGNGFGAPSLKHLLTRNGNLTSSEEEDLAKELLYLLPFIDERRLATVRNEITDYDPHQRKLIDAAALQRIMMTNFKQMPQQVQQKLFRLFATDPKRPRLISYDDMVDYLFKLKSFADANTAMLQKQEAAPTTGSMAQSPFYKRGDAKLILELELAMKEHNVEKLDFEGIRQAMNVLDRQHTGTLSESEIDEVLRNFGLFEVLKAPMRNLLSRCDMNGEKRYDWSILIRFFEKAQPVMSTEEPATKPKRDLLESELGFPMIAKVGGGAVMQRAKAPKTHFQTLQDLSNAQDSSHKRIEEAMQEMQALEIQRKKIEEALSRSDRGQVARAKEQLTINVNGAELPAIARQRAVTLDDSKQVVAISKHPRRPRSAEKLIEELSKLDSQNHGFISLAKARTMIQQFNDLHQLGLNSRFINSAISLCANANETHVNLRELINYLNAVMTNGTLTP